jgi:hypothetical protein
LRLAWGRDIEYKGDEASFFAESRRVQSWGDLSSCGQTTSVGVPAPGMSVWVLVGLGKVFGAEDPPALARAVQLCNIGALLALVWFIYWFMPSGEREAWLWAAALAAVNPFTVVLHRKIWNPSVLPLLTVVMLCGWQRRERRLGAFIWGFVGPCMGQIHSGGFFFTAGFALWALLFERRRVAWGWWLAGACLGSLPMLPWLWQVAHHAARAPYHADSWVHLLEFKFWMRWIMQSLGFGVGYNLGEEQRRAFLGYPTIFGCPTYLVGALHVVVAAVGVVVLLKAALLQWRERGAWLRRWNGGDSPNSFTVNAALWGFGLLLTASCFPTHRHYLVILFPLHFLWLARLALRRRDPNAQPRPQARVLLGVLWAAQLLITVGLLHFIHTNQRMGGEFGTVYAAQVDPASVAAVGPP